MDKKIIEFTELLKNTMSNKCHMIFNEMSGCYKDGHCDGHCVMFKNVIKKYIEDMKNNK